MKPKWPTHSANFSPQVSQVWRRVAAVSSSDMLFFAGCHVCERQCALSLFEMPSRGSRGPHLCGAFVSYRTLVQTWQATSHGEPQGGRDSTRTVVTTISDETRSEHHTKPKSVRVSVSI